MSLRPAAVYLCATAVLGCASSAAEPGGGGGTGGHLQKPTYSEMQPGDFEALPENTELNLGPLARPSDYPEAQAWKDPVPPSDCCEPISQIFSVDPVAGSGVLDDGTQGPPTVEWAENLWGVSWKTASVPATVDFRTIDPERLVVGPIEHPFQFDGRDPEESSMRWANDRFAVTYSPYHEGIYVGMLNRYGYAPWGSFPTNLHTTGTVIARYTAYNAWLVAGRSVDPTGSSPDSLIVAAVDNSGIRTNDPAVNLGAASAIQAIVGLKNRADVVWTTPTGISSRSFVWPFDESTAGQELKLLDGEGYAFAAVAFRDSVVTAVETNNRVMTFSIDPWTNEILSGPYEIAAIEWPGEAAVGLGAAEVEGYLGVCYTRHGPGGMTVVFRLIGPDGRPWSRENVLTTGDKLVPSCSVAFNGEAWSIAWWLAGFTDNIIHVQLLRPTP